MTTRPHRPTSEQRDPVLVLVRLRILCEIRDSHPSGSRRSPATFCPAAGCPMCRYNPHPRKPLEHRHAHLQSVQALWLAPTGDVASHFLVHGDGVSESCSCPAVLFTRGGGGQSGSWFFQAPLLTRRRPRSFTAPFQTPASSRTPRRSASHGRTRAPVCAPLHSLRSVRSSSPASSRRTS